MSVFNRAIKDRTAAVYGDDISQSSVSRSKQCVGEGQGEGVDVGLSNSLVHGDMNLSKLGNIAAFEFVSSTKVI